MEKFRDQIHKKCSVKMQPLDSSEFLFKLETRIKRSQENRKMLLVSFLLLFFLCTLTLSQFGAPYDQDILFYFYVQEPSIGTDLWNLDRHSIYHEEDYYNDVTYYLLDEYRTWETLEFIHEILLNREVEL